MKLNFAGIWVFSLLLSSMAPVGSIGQAQPVTATIAPNQDPPATRELVREIQFMLLRLGLDPGPLDGRPFQMTNRAVQRFVELHHLPSVELQLGAKVPNEFLARLRAETARTMFGAAGKTETAPGSGSPATTAPVPFGEGPLAPPTTTAPATPVPPKPPPSDRFASCVYDPEDFHIGTARYTPDTFLKEGFDGSTVRAVANLKDRLEEGRQIADKIGITALKEVQRQARVLQYFECRLKIEEASVGKS